MRHMIEMNSLVHKVPLLLVMLTVGCVEDCGATVFLPICDITSSTVVDVFSICTILYNEGQRLEAIMSDAFSQSVKRHYD